MSSARTEQEAPENVEAIDAWNGPLFDRFVEFRKILCDGLAVHGDAALEVLAARPGERILDVGCGFGDTTSADRRRVGASGRGGRVSTLRRGSSRRPPQRPQRQASPTLAFSSPTCS